MPERRLYLAYGLVIELPFACPAFPPAAAAASADVRVLEGSVPRVLPESDVSDPAWDAAPGRWLFRGGGRSGRFLVEGGDRVLLQRNPGAEEPLLVFHLLSRVLPAVLRHRGMIVLHANVARTPGGGGAMVMGESGSGKSTALAELVARGCLMVSDDISVARLRPDKTLEVLPGVSQVHLTEESAAVIGAKTDGLTRYPWRRGKAAVPFEADMVDSPVRPTAVHVLRVGANENLRTVRLKGQAAFDALLAGLLGPVLRMEHAAHLTALSTLAEQAPVTLVERPAQRWTAGEIADLILEGAS